MACKRSAVRSRLAPPEKARFRSPSSRGLGHRPFTAVTGVRTPLGTPSHPEPVKSLALDILLRYASKTYLAALRLDNLSKQILLLVA